MAGSEIVGATEEGGPLVCGCGAVAGDMHPQKDHCNTGCNLDTRTTEGTPRKKENKNDLSAHGAF